MAARLDKLLAEADAAMDQVPPAVEMASKFFEKLTNEASEKVWGKEKFSTFCEKYGEFHASFGDPDAAVTLFKQAIGLDWENSTRSMLFLAQMWEGHEALNMYKKWMEMLETTTKNWRLTVDERKKQKVSIYCAVVELFMTDLCDEPDAQQQCENALEKAHNIDWENVEVLVGLCTYNKVIGECGKAREYALKAAKKVCVDENERARWEIDAAHRAKEQEGSSSSSGDVTMDEGSNSKSDVKPAAEMDEVEEEQLVALWKNMIELELDETEDVLVHLLQRDEESVEVWYLYWVLHSKRGEAEEGKEALEKCNEYLKKAGGADDPEWQSNIKQLAKQLAKQK